MRGYVGGPCAHPSVRGAGRILYRIGMRRQAKRIGQWTDRRLACGPPSPASSGHTTIEPRRGQMRGWKSLLLTGAIAAFSPGLAFAQATLAGVVRDSSGALLPGVTV